jgi:hypothetical protein
LAVGEILECEARHEFLGIVAIQGVQVYFGRLRLAHGLRGGGQTVLTLKVEREIVSAYVHIGLLGDIIFNCSSRVEWVEGESLKRNSPDSRSS